MKKTIPKEALDFFTKKGKKGGLATKAKYGVEHYRERAAHMNKVRKEKRDSKVAK